LDYLTRLLARKQEIEEVLANTREDLMTPWAESINLYDQYFDDNASEVYKLINGKKQPGWQNCCKLNWRKPTRL
jgi:hypothetical protein